MNLTIFAGKGGVGKSTSATAIISIELNKPCIIGIKNVAKLLKYGDRVEVDTNNEVVKKL